MKFAFQFVGSSFMRGKVRVSYTPTDFVAAIESVGGDYISREVEIEGNRWVFVTIPYMSPFYRQPLQNFPNSEVPLGVAGPCGYSGVLNRPNITYGKIAISVMTPLSITDTDVGALYYINCFVAAGEDFSFGRFCGRAYAQQAALNEAGTGVSTGFGLAWAVPWAPPYDPEEEKEIAKDQCSLQEIFRGSFQPLRNDASYSTEHGFLGVDRSLTVRELCHRYSKLLWSVTGAIPGPLGLQSYEDGTMPSMDFPDFSTITELCGLFRFWRGSMRYRTVQQPQLDGGIRLALIVPDESSLLTPFNTMDTYATGIVIKDNVVDDGYGVRVEWPWDDIIPYRSVFAESDPNFGSKLLIDAVSVFRSVGDDFGLAWQVAAPIIWWYESAEAKATGGNQPGHKAKMTTFTKIDRKTAPTSSAEGNKQPAPAVEQWLSPHIGRPPSIHQ
jgi:hypothetical protein